MHCIMNIIRSLSPASAPEERAPSHSGPSFSWPIGHFFDGMGRSLLACCIGGVSTGGDVGELLGKRGGVVLYGEWRLAVHRGPIEHCQLNTA